MSSYADRERAYAMRPIDRHDLAELERLAGEVRRLRIQARMSRSQLGRAARVSERMVRHVESATRRSRYNTLERLAEPLALALGLDWQELTASFVRLAGASLAPPKGVVPRTPYRPGMEPVFDSTGEFIGMQRRLRDVAA